MGNKKEKKKKYKAMPTYIDKTPNPKYSWDFFNIKEQVKEENDFSYIIIPKMLYNDNYFLKVVTELFFGYKNFFYINLPNEKLKFYAIVFNEEHIMDKTYLDFLEFLKNHLQTKHVTLKDFVKEELYDYKCNFSRIMIYNSTNELISSVICSQYGEEVYDIRNFHGVKVAKTEDNFLYNFLTKTIKNLPLSALDEEILFYITTKNELKIKLLTGNYVSNSKKYTKVKGTDHLYKKKKPKR